MNDRFVPEQKRYTVYKSIMQDWAKDATEQGCTPTISEQNKTGCSDSLSMEYLKIAGLCI